MVQQGNVDRNIPVGVPETCRAHRPKTPLSTCPHKCAPQANLTDQNNTFQDTAIWSYVLSQENPSLQSFLLPFVLRVFPHSHKVFPECQPKKALKLTRNTRRCWWDLKMHYLACHSATRPSLGCSCYVMERRHAQDIH